MALNRRARAVAEATPPNQTFHDVILFVGAGFVLGGALAPNLAAVGIGLAMLAYELGRRLVNPERAYMEGFTDGLTAADTLAALDRGTAQDVRRVLDGLDLPTPGAPDGGTRPRQRAHREPVEQPLDWNTLAGVALGDRPARPLPGAFVDEPITTGPRPPNFPPLPTTFNGDFSASGDGTDRASTGG
jgi:hypothetical protein